MNAQLYLLIFYSTVTLAREYPCINEPCSINDDALKFYFLGDWGGSSSYPYYTDIQLRVADGLSTLNKRKNAHFYISNGDHFYYSGVKNVNDIRFVRTFENIFDRPAHQKPWYLVAGNHDHNGNVTAQIAYTHKSKRWMFPAKFYSFEYKTSKNFTAEFIMIDTVELCGQIVDDTINQSVYNGQPTSYQKHKWDWINHQLNLSRADYLFVVGHYPITSAGFHGPNGCMGKFLKPMLEMYRVNGYLAGHDHNLQHMTLSESNWTINYVISGFGSRSDSYERPSQKLLPVKVQFFYPQKSRSHHYSYDDYNSDRQKGGFVYCELNEKYGKYSFRDGDGKELYTSKFSPR